MTDVPIAHDAASASWTSRVKKERIVRHEAYARRSPRLISG
jgi:hypothetical protein